MTDTISSAQFSDYDERPDPKTPGQQGVLFRKEAPARGTPDERRGITTDRWGESHDTRIDKGRATGFVPSGGELYHGTAANLKPGSMIKPGKPANFESYNSNGHGVTQDVNHEHAFATPDNGSAYRFAKIAQETRANYAPGGRPPRASVYTVRPVGPVQLDREVRDTVQDRGGAGMGYEYGDEGGDEMAFQSKQGFKVTARAPLADAQEKYRSFNEDELGQEPGTYPFAPKTSEQRHQDRYGW